MIFSENKQLFGFDGMERIVAVEFSVPNQIDIFLRESDGSTSIRREEFSPFLWTSSAAIPLEGALALDQLMTFPDWRSYQEARSRLAKAETPLFAFNDPVQQYLTFSGRTLFKGMRFEDLRRLQIGVQTAVSGSLAFPAPTATHSPPLPLAIAAAGSRFSSSRVTLRSPSAAPSRLSPR